jgi:hypothetical protein
MILHNLKKTCDSFPSQWEAVNEQGQNVYIRFRSDTLTVHCPYDVANEDYDSFIASQILKLEHVRGDQHAGYMDEGEMLKLTGYVWDSTYPYRAHFHRYLRLMGYDIEETNPIFNELLHLHLSGEWGEMVKAEFGSTWVWQSKVAEKLLEPFKVISF